MRNMNRLDIRILVLIAAVLLLFGPQIVIQEAGGDGNGPLTVPIIESILGN